jgi:DNA-binding PadR family transcriptional regulator
MKIEFILEILSGLGEFSIDFLDVMMSDRAASYKKLRGMTTYGHFYKELFSKPKRLSFEEHRKIERQKFYSLLHHLQKEGFVEKHKNKEKRNSFWKITLKGKKKLKEIKEKQNNILPKTKYEAQKDNEFKIIIFDIPEKDRRKRNWLRQNLLALEFSPLQKSVWGGNTKLPEDFLKELKELSILPYLEIFAVSKSGTIGKYKPNF